MNVTTTEVFDQLDIAIDEMEVSVEMLTIVYRNYLVRLASEGRFSFIPAALLQRMEYFVNAELLESANIEGSVGTKLRAELRSAGAEYQANSAEDKFVRCLRFLYVKKSDWENVAHDSPVYYFFSSLQKLLGDVQLDFVNFFRAALFDSKVDFVTRSDQKR